MRVKGAKTIILGLLGLFTSISSWAVPQAYPSNPGATQSGAGLAAIRSPYTNRLAQQEQPQVQSQPEPAKSPYAVEDLVLGARVQFESEAYLSYKCGPSEQFTGFTWCRRTRTDKGPRGRVYSSYSMLHSADGNIVYTNRSLEPSFYSSGKAKEEIQRISQKYGASPRILDMPHRPGLPDGLIAVWGDVVLQPVDPTNISQLADGKTPSLGFMVDFIADFQRSAKVGLPIYRISGGAGSVWAASFGQNGRGTLRVVAVDASKLSSPESDQAAAVTQSPSQQTEKEKEPEAKVADLQRTIENLKADLASSAEKFARLKGKNLETERALKEAAHARFDADNAKRQIEQASIADRNAAYGVAKFRSWQVLAYIALGGLITLLAIGLSVLWPGWKRPILASLRGPKPGPTPKEAAAKAEGIKIEGTEDTFGRELEKHVADLDATHSQTPV